MYDFRFTVMKTRNKNKNTNATLHCSCKATTISFMTVSSTCSTQLGQNPSHNFGLLMKDITLLLNYPCCLLKSRYPPATYGRTCVGSNVAQAHTYVCNSDFVVILSHQLQIIADKRFIRRRRRMKKSLPCWNNTDTSALNSAFIYFSDH